MRVRLRFFAALREQLGERLEREVAPGTTVGALWRTLVIGNQQLLSIPVRFAVNQRYVDDDYEVSAGDEVAVFPPVSGGR